MSKQSLFILWEEKCPHLPYYMVHIHVPATTSWQVLNSFLSWICWKSITITSTFLTFSEEFVSLSPLVSVLCGQKTNWNIRFIWLVHDILELFIDLFSTQGLVVTAITLQEKELKIHPPISVWIIHICIVLLVIWFFLKHNFSRISLVSFQKSHWKIIENSFLIYHHGNKDFQNSNAKVINHDKKTAFNCYTGFLNQSLNLQHCYGQSPGALGGWPHLGGNTPTCPSSCRGCDSHRGSCSTASYTATACPSSPLEGSVWQ